MVGAIVEHLGEPAPVPRRAVRSAAFPGPAVMAEAGEDFYRGVAKAGYRGAYLISLARSVASGELDLEALGRPGELPDEEVEPAPGSPRRGPYAASHVMMMLGRYRPLILDSWTRPTYAKLTGRPATDAQIERRFRRFGPWAGLAFWLTLTRSWVPEASPGLSLLGVGPMVRARSRGVPSASWSARRPAPARRRSTNRSRSRGLILCSASILDRSSRAAPQYSVP